jgi:hypothetical protein
MSLEKIDELAGLKACIDNKAVFGGVACAQDIAIGLICT